MSQPVFQMASPPDAYRRRRANVGKWLTKPLAIFSGHGQARNYPANVFPFRPASWFSYFGGPPLENAALLIEPGSDGAAGCAIFRTPSGPDDAVWMGPAPSDADVAAAAGLDTGVVFELDSLRARTGAAGAYFLAPPCVDTLAFIEKLRLKGLSDDEARRLIDQRLIKDEHELGAMRIAAEIGMDAHRAALAAVRPGATEAEIAAEFYAVLTANQVDVPYNPIISVHGEILHAVGFPNTLAEGQMLLFDASAESRSYYANDITRTVPVSGVFDATQRHLYNTVRRALEECCAAAVPGRRYREIHDLAGRIICEGLVEAELLGHRFSMPLDCHSGFGLNDRIWFPYAHSRAPMPHLAEMHALMEIRRSSATVSCGWTAIWRLACASRSSRAST
ncbi:MAG: aminopeptidase P N-terminal domain-containing protein [Planctomycetes bacterium]|nr:aminopeptidase P N-terminal domain-containing protein [Planctomycetota bacterium]